jgi:hypothetical protein
MTTHSRTKGAPAHSGAPWCIRRRPCTPEAAASVVLPRVTAAVHNDSHRAQRGRADDAVAELQAGGIQLELLIGPRAVVRRCRIQGEGLVSARSGHRRWRGVAHSAVANVPRPSWWRACPAPGPGGGEGSRSWRGSMATMMRRRTSSTAVVAVVVAVVFAALTSCSSDSSDGSPAEGRPSGSGSGSPASDPIETATPSPSPTGPCADGTCEIEVAVGDIVTVPETYGLGPIEVTAITGGEVEMVAPLTGSGYSISGCSGGGGVSSEGAGGVGLSCGEGPAATINDAMSLEVVEILDTAAVLRIEPAG